METLDAFKTDKLQLLIASDVAARGLDIPAVSHVFNFDVPTHAEDYVHRIGRTGRAGRSGTSITLATPADGKYVDAIVKLIQRDIPMIKLDASLEVEPVAADAEPSERRGRRDRHRGERKSDAPRSNVHKADSVKAEAPAPQAAKPASRDRAPTPERPAARPARSLPVGGGSQSPFGSDGPVPAFLLRPAGAR